MNQRQVTALAERIDAAGRALVDAARLLTENGSALSNGTRTGHQPAPEERLSSRQLGAIRVASRRAGLSTEQLSGLIAEVSTDAVRAEQLSRMEASALLDRLNQSNGYEH